MEHKCCILFHFRLFTSKTGFLPALNGRLRDGNRPKCNDECSKCNNCCTKGKGACWSRADARLCLPLMRNDHVGDERPMGRTKASSQPARLADDPGRREDVIDAKRRSADGVAVPVPGAGGLEGVGERGPIL